MLTDDKWADLPTIQCHPTMSDEDREFDSDLAYMRDLVTELHVHGSVEHLAGIRLLVGNARVCHDTHRNSRN